MTNRVFTISEIENLRVAYETFFNEAIELTEMFKSIQSDAATLQAQVPSNAISSALSDATATQYSTSEFEQMRAEMDKTLKRIQAQIPDIDTQMAGQLTSLSNIVGDLKRYIRKLSIFTPEWRSGITCFRFPQHDPKCKSFNARSIS